MKLCRMLLALALSATVFGCASNIKKADIPATANPSEEISKLENSIQEGYNSQLDVLASNDFEKARYHLREAKEELAKNKKQSEVLEDVAYSKAYIQRAEDTASDRRSKILGVIDARNKAVVAGARQFAPTQADMGEVDSRLRNKAEKLDKLSAADIAEFNLAYSDVELKAIQNKQLGQAKARIEAAKDANASRYSPRALKNAEVDYGTAENLIKANRNDKDTYMMQVAQANKSAMLLTAILAETNRGARDEGVATKVVMQNEKIKTLSTQLNSASDQNTQLTQEKARLDSVNSDLNVAVATQNEQLDQTTAEKNRLDAEKTRLDAEMSAQNEKLSAANMKVNFQKSLAKAQAQFSKDEAEVFQQGDNVVIRLKKIQFASGKSELPTASLAVLAKVKNVAEDLGPKMVRVEGHTDSVGSEIINKTLSQSRADTIAQYLQTSGIPQAKVETEGVGFSKPLASNKTKEGRAQNRRVDVIITPDSSVTTDSSNE